MEKFNAVTTFFRQTFRRHSGEEYSEILTRGLREKEGLNKKYPWAYVRIFALIFVLYAIFLLIVRFTSNQLFVPTIVALASLCFNFSFLLLVYELYPQKDLSFMSVCLVMLIGGAASHVVVQILYSLVKVYDPWLSAVAVGFFEELPKAGAAVLAIIIARKNSPLAGFVLGAAVGCGFSIAEDMGYIIEQANQFSAANLPAIIEVTFARGLSAYCTHTLWTAAVGWAYCHFSRHLANLAVYLITLLSCGLHICWDLPLSLLASGFIYAGCTIVSATECVLIVYFERKKLFNPPAADGAIATPPPVEIADETCKEQLSKNNPLYWRHWGNFTLTIGAVLMALIAVIYCSIPFSETYGTATFYNPEMFIDFMQDGIEFNAEQNRRYDKNNTENNEVSDGRVIQRVEAADGITYRYVYRVDYDTVSANTYYIPETVYATVRTEAGEEVTYNKENVYYQGKLYASFFRVNQSVTGYNFNIVGDITVIIYNPAFERDLSDWQYLSLFITFGVICAASAVCYISLQIKSWRVKKLCSTDSASSAE